jgi:hypothetical protein
VARSAPESIERSTPPVGVAANDQRFDPITGH